MSALTDFLASVHEKGAVQTARDVSNSPGAAPLHAAWRGGLKDLQDAVLVAFPDSLRAREEPGSIASPTAQLVTENMTGRNVDVQKDEVKPEKNSPDIEME